MKRLFVLRNASALCSARIGILFLLQVFVNPGNMFSESGTILFFIEQDTTSVIARDY